MTLKNFRKLKKWGEISSRDNPLMTCYKSYGQTLISFLFRFESNNLFFGNKLSGLFINFRRNFRKPGYEDCSRL